MNKMSFFMVLIFFSIAYSQNEISNNCETKEICSECIQKIDCVWCIAQNITIGNSRSGGQCFSKISPLHELCPKNLMIDPHNTVQITENKPLSDEGLAVQISPQKLKLSLRKGEEFHLSFQYAQAKNYPVDLYYIMDLSASMEDHREKLAKLGGKLANTMKNITENFRLGFGSFVDKVDLPFVSTVPFKLKSPCRLNKRNQIVYCVPPYSFRNHMSLTNDYKKFSSEVFKAQVSGNLDSPEGGFDAIMQAIVCKEQIGWRAQARHLLVFSTDAEFHIAGDGKLAGIVEPNDGKCHMLNNFYTDFLVYDYPSISHINYVAKENNINIIFAIVNARENVVTSYKMLSSRIENSNTGILDEKSENVVNLVLDNYNKIVDSVTITANAPEYVDVKIHSNCANPKENGCTNIHVGEVVNFTATIKLLECLKNTTSKRTLLLKPEALDESIEIELEILCNCNCEFPSNEYYKSNAKECTNFGNLECGICNCNPGRFGRNCECDSQSSDSIDIENCKKNVSDSEICSGLGTCKCGKCECNKRNNPNEKIYGKYCQCDNYSCKRDRRSLCSGNGVCDCGKCQCHSGWTGDVCQCPESSNSCVNPGSDGAICNGRGSCVCGKCECNVDKYRYSGKYCEECPTCPAQRCKELQNCVECQTYGSGIFNKNDCIAKCNLFMTEKVKKIDVNTKNESTKICRVLDANSCTFLFEYSYDNNQHLIVRAEEKKICSESPDILPWIFGVIGSILIAGLIMVMVWKICTTVHDRREYAKFENERKKLKWNRNDNPLYKQATSTFSNPVYNRESVRLKNKES